MRSVCRDRLADYEIPRTVLVLDGRLPQTVTRTIDRVALRERFGAG